MYEAYNRKKKNLRNLYLSFSRSPFIKEKNHRKLKLEKISFKEAIKDKE